ncbi:uncharacterized protein LOC120631069 [Pararge aegeria]|uniref:uncharacterized protein LOC120631069 n=1 Tax=Pararge aegeria TaxID=116150 RepID=UPI0019D16989|nr:uncharacterized protein LOC120631069 [Pararge aegeria]
MTSSARGSPIIAKYKLSRRGKKLQISDDQRTLIALPRDVPERTWAEILHKEEIDLMIFDVREEILEDTFNICYQKYMARQNSLFTVHCAAEAWLKLLNWYFFRHDPGEDPSAYPSCFIPKRVESWEPDQLPDPSPKDTWCKQELNILEASPEEGLKRWPSSSSIEMPLVEDIPEEYWFPGKVNLPTEYSETSVISSVSVSTSYEESLSSNVCAESEVLQNVTDYNTSEAISAKESTCSELKHTTPVHGPLRGAGDSAGERAKTKRRTEKSKVFSKSNMIGRSKGLLPPLAGDSRSKMSIISDCRLRNLRLDTQYEITSEKINTPPGEPVKRK